jgi:alpha-D-ribose 1-methylphosphonate 5-triphosphate diphosphatase PhnM
VDHDPNDSSGTQFTVYVNREADARESAADDEAGKQVKLAELEAHTPGDRATHKLLELYLDYTRKANAALLQSIAEIAEHRTALASAMNSCMVRRQEQLRRCVDGGDRTLSGHWDIVLPS